MSDNCFDLMNHRFYLMHNKDAIVNVEDSTEKRALSIVWHFCTVSLCVSFFKSEAVVYHRQMNKPTKDNFDIHIKIKRLHAKMWKVMSVLFHRVKIITLFLLLTKITYNCVENSWGTIFIQCSVTKHFTESLFSYILKYVQERWIFWETTCDSYQKQLSKCSEKCLI